MRELYEPLEFLSEFRSLREEHGVTRSPTSKKYTSIIFSEEIIWLKNKGSRADLEGKDSDGNIVIVEVKIWHTNPSERRAQEHSAIEKILDHANVHSTKYHADSMRLFIAGFVKAPNIELACESLRADGVNIYYIDISDIVDTANKENYSYTRYAIRTLGWIVVALSSSCAQVSR